MWQLEDVKQMAPQWHAFYVAGSKRRGSGDESDDDDMPGLLPVKSKGKASGKNPPRLAITNGDTEDSDTSMPSLQTVSDSSDEDESDDENVYDEYSDNDDHETESESGYDTDEEDALRDMLREAMDAAMATPDFFDPKSAAPEFDELTEDRKGNPFLKLLGSLRGSWSESRTFMGCLPTLTQGVCSPRIPP